MEATSMEGICVAIRLRPLNSREINSGQASVFQCLPEYNSITQQNKDGQPIEGQFYQYDKVFNEESSTDEVYSYIAKDIVTGVAHGINGTIFAYGQTSSGKTFTMLGDEKHPGVLEQSAEDIFRHIEQSENRDFLLRVSFVEIYNEVIRDLLSDAADATVAIREDPKKGVYCEASELIITDFDSITRALKRGISRRTVESTAMNDTSSRSHTIFKYLEETRSTLQFASRAKLVTTNAVVNEVLDEAAKIRRLTKELNDLKERQHAGGVSDADYSRIEAEKAELLSRLMCVQEEKELQRVQLQRLRELVITNCAVVNDKKKKRHRDTWCPGALDGPPPQSFLSSISEGLQAEEEDSYRHLTVTSRKIALSPPMKRRVSDEQSDVMDMRSMKSSERDSLESSDSISDYVDVVSSLQFKNDELETLLQEKAEEVQLITSKINQLSDRLETATEKSAMYEMKISDLESEIYELKMTLPSGVQSTDNQTSPIDTAITTTANTSIMNDSVDNDIVSKLQLKISDMELQIEKLQIENNALLQQQQMTTMSPVKSCETADSETTSSVSGRIALLAIRNVAELEKEVEMLNNKLNTMKQQLSDETSDHEERYSLLMKDHVSLLEKIASFESSQQILFEVEGKCSNLTALVNELEVEMNDRQTRLDETLIDLAVKNNELLKMKEDHEALVSAQQDQILLHQQLLDENRKQEEKYAVLEAEHASLLDKLTSLESTQVFLEEVEGKCCQLSVLVNELDVDKNDRQTRLDEAMTDLACKETELLMLKEENEALVAAQLEQISNLTASERVVGALTNELNTMKQQLSDETSDHEERYAMLMKDHVAMSEKITSFESSQQILFEVEGKCSSLTALVNELEVEMNDRQSRLDETLIDLAVRDNELLKMKEDYEAVVSAQREQIVSMEELVQSTEEIIGQKIRELSERINTLTMEKALAEERVVAAKALFEERKIASADEEDRGLSRISELANELKATQSTNTELQIQLQESTSMVSNLQHNMSVLQDEIVEKQCLYESEHDKYITLCNENTGYIARINELENELQQLTNDTVLTSESIETMQAKNDALQQDILSYVARISSLELELLITVEDRNGLIQNQQNKESSTIEQLQHQVHDVEEKLLGNEEKCKELTDVKELLTSCISDLEEEVQRSRELISQTENSLAVSTAQYENILTGLRNVFTLDSEDLIRMISDSNSDDNSDADVDVDNDVANCLDRQLAQLRLSYLQSKDHICELEMQTNHLNGLLETAEKAIADSLSEKEEILSIQSNSNGTVEHLINQLQEKSTIINELQAKAITLENEIISITNKSSTLLIEKDDLQRQFSVVQSERQVFEEKESSLRKGLDRNTEALHAELGTKDGEISRLMGLVKELESRVEVAEYGLSSTRQKENENDASMNNQKKRLEQLVTTVDILKSEKEALLEKLAAVSSELKDTADRAVRKEELLEKQISTLTITIDKLQHELQLASKQNDKVLFLEGQLGDSQGQVERLKIQCEKLRVDLEQANIQAQQELSSSSSQQEEELLQALEQKNADYVEVCGRLKRSKDQVTELQTELDNICAEYRVNNEELMEQSAALTHQLQTRSNELESLLTDTSSERMRLEEEIFDLKAQLKEQEEEMQFERSNRNDQSDPFSEERSKLINEMTALMEKCMDAEAKASNAVAETKRMRERMSEYDRASAKEHELVIQAAQMEMDNMQSKFKALEEESEELLMKAMIDCRGVRSDEKLAKRQYEELSVRFQQLEEKVLQYKDETDELKREKSIREKSEGRLSRASQKALEAAQDDVERLTRDRDTLRATMKLLEGDVLNANMERERLESEAVRYKAEVSDIIAAKDRRIEHLDKSKLTQELVDKFKVLKEDKEKYQAECKKLKQKLHDLMKVATQNSAGGGRNTSSSEGGSSSRESAAVHLELEEVRSKLGEVQHSLETSQTVAKSLKDKLGECARQLREYETERDAVIDVLEKHGIDTRGLLGSDSSGSVEDSVVDQDLAEAVAKLGSKLVTTQSQMQAHQSNVSKLQSRSRELEGQMVKLTTETEEVRSQKNSFEKRIDALRNSLQTAELASKNKAEEVESLRATMSTLQGELDQAMAHERSSSDAISSEIQALEEENIELMRENKELRKEAASYRVQLERNPTVMEPNLSSSSSVASSTESSVLKQKLQSYASKKDGENLHPNRIHDEISALDKSELLKAVSSTVLPTFSSTVEKINIEKERPVEIVSNNADGTKGRRTRVKAKALVSEVGSDEAGGECNQS
eukprot:gene2987-5859_t